MGRAVGIHLREAIEDGEEGYQLKEKLGGERTDR
jgi:hypothetical protein